MDERELVKRVLAGDVDAQNLFYRENAKRLYPVCAHFLGVEDSDSEDVIQEAFMIAFRKLGKFEFKSSLYTWLNHICVNLCYERLRKRKKTLASLEVDLEKISRSHSGLLESQKADEDEKQHRLRLMEKLMQTMGEKCRQVLELRDKRGESYINLARILKIPPGTVMSQLARCRKALKLLMENELKEAKS